MNSNNKTSGKKKNRPNLGWLSDFVKYTNFKVIYLCELYNELYIFHPETASGANSRNHPGVRAVYSDSTRRRL